MSVQYQQTIILTLNQPQEGNAHVWAFGGSGGNGRIVLTVDNRRVAVVQGQASVSGRTVTVQTDGAGLRLTFGDEWKQHVQRRARQEPVGACS